MPRSTARLRVKGIKLKRDSIAPNRRFTPAQEESQAVDFINGLTRYITTNRDCTVDG